MHCRDSFLSTTTCFYLLVVHRKFVLSLELVVKASVIPCDPY